MKFLIEIENQKYVVYSVVDTNWGGPAKNFIKQCDSEQQAKDLVQWLKFKYGSI